MPDRFLTLNELADKLRLSRSTIDAWRREGLPYIKMGRSIRFDEIEVMSWIKQNKSK
jgi:excisionase family DNA binding protein